MKEVVILPQSLLDYFWASIMSIAMAYNIAIIPFDIAFNMDEDSHTCTQHSVAMEVIVSLIYFVDIFFRTRRAYEEQ